MIYRNNTRRFLVPALLLALVVSACESKKENVAMTNLYSQIFKAVLAQRCE